MHKTKYLAPDAEALEMGVGSVFLDASYNTDIPALTEEDWSDIW